MKKLGITLTIIGLLMILFSNSIITGAAINDKNSSFVSIIGTLVFISGLALIISSRHGKSKLEETAKEAQPLRASAKKYSELRNEAQQWLKQGYIPEKTRELISVAKRSGYNIESSREGYKIKKYGKVITEIPGHKRIKKYTSKNILKALATGESSNYRRRSA